MSFNGLNGRAVATLGRNRRRSTLRVSMAWTAVLLQQQLKLYLLHQL